MGKSVRILHTADSHIGAELVIRPRHSRPRRGDDFIASFRRVLARACELDVDLVVHAGDLFDRSRPSARALAAAGEPLLDLAVAGIPVVIVPGNHERSMIPASLLLSHPNIRIAAEPRTFSFNLRGTSLAVTAVPCLRRQAASTFAKVLAATRWPEVRADLRVLAIHQTIESATCGPANFRFRSSDDVVERSTLPQQFDYVAAGHVHRHQKLAAANGNGQQIVYSGSPDRISFAEASEPKGCVLVELVEGRLVPTFLEHDVRPMSTWPMDVTSLTTRRIREEFETILASLPSRAMAQVRMSGRCPPGTLRALGFSTLARAIRPDVLVSVSTRAVEYVAPNSRVSAKCAFRSVFTRLHAPPREPVRVSVRDVARLPSGSGTYAMYDSSGRVLYIGKSNTIRARVRSHLRGKANGNRFRGWSRQIAEIEARTAHSNLEALLIEAELIRRVRPPFNRQMRRWRDYCYLCENGNPYRQLDVCKRRTAGDVCFGPFRSRHLARSIAAAVSEHFRLAHCPEGTDHTSPIALLADDRTARLCTRYFKGVCSGPCASRVTPADYDALVAARDELLAGRNDATVRTLEEEGELAAQRALFDEPAQRRVRLATTLRSAFQHTQTLRDAEEMVDGVLLMPGPDERRTTAVLTGSGVRFGVLAPDPADVDRFLARHRRLTRSTRGERADRLPITMLDTLCLVVRTLRETGSEYIFISADQMASCSAEVLLETGRETLRQTDEPAPTRREDTT
ncbi:MAG: metallophosphoesterase [Phycisphaerae bacterium]|jgi:DNA repair exonuclease SbcCD nuclease subunit